MADARVVVHLEEAVGAISPLLYGHFVEHLGRCVEEGIWVGEDSQIANVSGIRSQTVEALRAIGAPVIRWPGGCFADDYHWEDGVGPRERRPRRVNLWWGNEDSNAFGTDEFVRFCRLAGAEPYLCVNVGSGTPLEAKSWMEYCNYDGDTHYTQLRRANGNAAPFEVKWWAVGNENWGCGGHFEPEEYAAAYRRFATYLRQLGKRCQLVACGHNTPDWNLRFLQGLRGHWDLVDHLSIHRYFNGGHETEFTETQYYALLAECMRLEDDLREARAALDLVVRARKRIGVIVDEWGVWHPQAHVAGGHVQENTLRDAVAAATVLDLFNRWCDVVTMANLAQTVNVLQSVIRTEGEAFWVTPTYHVFDLYRAHAGKIGVRAEVDGDRMAVKRSDGSSYDLPLVSASASVAAGRRQVVVSLVNRSLDSDVECRVRLEGGAAVAGRARRLWAEAANAHNSAEEPNAVAPAKAASAAKGSDWTEALPAHSVTVVEIALG